MCDGVVYFDYFFRFLVDDGVDLGGGVDFIVFF